MKLKYCLLGVLVTTIIFSIVNITLVVNNKDVVIIKDYEGFQEDILKVDKKISKIKDEECKSSFIKMSDNIKRTHFSKNTTVEDYYRAYFLEDNFLNIYKDVEEICQISEDNSRYVLALASYTFPDSIKIRYSLKHEFIFKDRKLRRELYKNNDEVGSYTSKVLELKVINLLLESLSV